MDKELINGRLTSQSVKTISGSLEQYVKVGSGTNDYELLINKPQINGVELIGNTIMNYATQADIDATVGNIAILLSLI